MLTAIYMLTISVRAFFPGKDFDYAAVSDTEDPGWMMLLPLVVFVMAVVIFGLCPQPFLDVLQGVVSSLTGVK